MDGEDDRPCGGEGQSASLGSARDIISSSIGGGGRRPLTDDGQGHDEEQHGDHLDEKGVPCGQGNIGEGRARGGEFTPSLVASVQLDTFITQLGRGGGGLVPHPAVFVSFPPLSPPSPFPLPRPVDTPPRPASFSARAQRGRPCPCRCPHTCSRRRPRRRSGPGRASACSSCGRRWRPAGGRGRWRRRPG